MFFCDTFTKKIMKEEIREQLPKWSNFNDGVIYDMVQTNDLDSFISCKLMEMYLWFETVYFYDFEKLYINSNYIGYDHEKLYIDAATTIDKSIDNHVQAMNVSDCFNENSVNLNNIGRYTGCSDNYFNKYCGSTLLTIMSLRNIPIPEDEEMQMILLAIDTSFAGYYSNYKQAQESNKKHLKDILGFEQLYNLQGRKTKQDFYNIIRKYNLSTDIIVDADGKLQYKQDISLLREKLLTCMGIDITLPKEELIAVEEYTARNINIPANAPLKEWTKEYAWDNGYYIHTMAMTGKYNLSYSYKKIAV